MRINTTKAYLFGVLVGGGVIHNGILQIAFPYKKWGDLKINPQRAGVISEDILKRIRPLFKDQYKIEIYFKVEKDWKIVSQEVTEELLTDLKTVGLPIEGEFRYLANLDQLIPFLKSKPHIQSFITGLVDTVGSMVVSHRRFTKNFQIISLEFKGNNFSLVKSVVQLLQAIGCDPDQVLWNHPNQHSGDDKYYKSWKKGFKVRVCLDDYLLKGGFFFQAKQNSAVENKKEQDAKKSAQKTAKKISGRVPIHMDQHSDWLPEDLRGAHFIHNQHFYSFFGLKVSETLDLKKVLSHYEKYFCPFTCLTRGTINEINKIKETEKYLRESKYSRAQFDLGNLIAAHKRNTSTLLFGNCESDGFPINYVLQGLAYVIAASTNNKIKGKRVLGKYIELLIEYARKPSFKNLKIIILRPNRGTCLIIANSKFGALVGYVNDAFNKSLITGISGSKVILKEPTYDKCVLLK